MNHRVVNTDWKIYTPEGNFKGATVHAKDAAVLIAALGEGAQIRWRHHTHVWTEGSEAQPAAESYDFVAATCHNRVEEVRKAIQAVNDAREALRHKQNPRIAAAAAD